MPDENKLDVMKVAEYAIAKSCWTCVHSGLDLRSTTVERGSCKLLKFRHKKHGEELDTPCSPALVCKHWQQDDMVEYFVGPYYAHVGKP